MKFAKDAPNKQQNIDQKDNSGQAIGNNALSKPGKRKAEVEQNKENSSSKAIDKNTHAKQPTEPNREAKRLKSSKHDTKKPSLQTKATADDEEKPTRKSKKARKSVSFASGTKSDDDASAVEIPSDIDNDPDAVNARRLEKRRKREERQKSHGSQRSEPESQPQNSNSSDPMLSYITTYHNSRSEWKFQKNRETAVLKHALSVERIPPSHTSALSVYLSGLKGEAAKQRIGLSAKEIITEDDDEALGSGEAESQRAIYDKALNSFRKQLSESGGNSEKQAAEGEEDQEGLNATWLQRLNKRKRAELVYYVTQGDILQEKPAQPKKLKRKARTTAVISDSSSSSSSSSDSSSGSSSEDGSIDSSSSSSSSSDSGKSCCKPRS